MGRAIALESFKLSCDSDVITYVSVTSYQNLVSSSVTGWTCTEGQLRRSHSIRLRLRCHSMSPAIKHEFLGKLGWTCMEGKHCGPKSVFQCCDSDILYINTS
ncbi:hypothetical protein AVEN_90099-1 [Araneus ventricosus]|uniref:Uncharacterized protein n=1 Tax=Araneus ventricosus TaxID=182803 RepID=A0A4Y2V3D3_ARAVE|nr:hypothetical protein AVEN_90099-1 [Araneus ventricosus]